MQITRSTQENIHDLLWEAIGLRADQHRRAENAPPPVVPDITSFGEATVAEPHPQVQLQFPYNINARIIDARPNQSGTVTQADNMMVLQTGAAANSSGTALSRDPIAYRPGQGVVIRFTALFAQGVIGSTQWAGAGDVGDGLFFGYNGTDFGVMRRHGGAPEVEILTVTVKSTTAENITITLDGDAKTDVTVTDASATDVTTTANEIAAADYSDVGAGWSASAHDETVRFVSWDSAAHDGTFSLSGASPSTAGTFAQSVAAVAAVEEFIAQSTWNHDPRPNLAHENGNVYQIRYQWLGYGAVSFYVEDSISGMFVLVHRLHYANTAQTPSLQNPSLPLCFQAKNTTNTTNVTLKTASAAGMTEGLEAVRGATTAVAGTQGSISTTDIPVLSFHGMLVFQGKLNRTKVEVRQVAAAADATKSLIISAWLNPALVGSSFTAVDAATSTIMFDTTATALSGGFLLARATLSKAGSAEMILPDLIAGQTVCISAEAAASGTNEVSVSATFVEEF